MISIPEHPEDSAEFKPYSPQLAAYVSRPRNGLVAFDWCLITNNIRFSEAYWHCDGSNHDDGSDLGLLSYVHQDDRERAIRECRAAIQCQETSLESLYRMQCRHKTVQISLIKAEIVRNKSQAVRMHGLAIDITNVPRLIMRIGSA